MGRSVHRCMFMRVMCPTAVRTLSTREEGSIVYSQVDQATLNLRLAVEDSQHKAEQSLARRPPGPRLCRRSAGSAGAPELAVWFGLWRYEHMRTCENAVQKSPLHNANYPIEK